MSIAAVMEPVNREPLRVLLIGFCPVTRAGLQAILATDKGLEVDGEATNGDAALLRMRAQSAVRRPFDIVLSETGNGAVDGVQATRLIKEEFPEVSVMVLTESYNDSHVIDAIHAGAGGYIFLKEMIPKELLESIHRVVEGGTQMKTELLRKAVDALIQNGRKTLAERTAEAAHLSPREVDVLRLMANGDTNKMISEALDITVDTTKKHVQNVISKLQARSRTHAAIIAAQAGIVGIPVTPLMPILNGD
ncbi:MAG: response regulator transcription factor [Chloroflexi bacterium]|nr:response regulator transcription factor [Chloroflexota bacterium]